MLKELKEPYKKWLTEEVTYIIFPEERLQFLQLKTDTERQEFIKQFWLRHDPTPNTQANEFKEEHYRRIEYANLHFAAGVAGWRTDRGLFYILYGPPDEIQRNEGAWTLPEGDDVKIAGAVGGSHGEPVPVYPFQKWRYRYIAGIGFNVQLEFVDRNGSGAYGLAADPGQKYEYVPIPGGLFDAATLGLLGRRASREMMDLRYRQIERMVVQGKLLKVSAEPETEREKNPETLVTSRLVRDLLPVQLRVEFFRAEKGGSIATVILGFQKSDLKFTLKGDTNRAVVNLRGFLTDAVGHTVAKFANGIEWKATKVWLDDPALALYQRPLKLPPGRYLLHLDLLDVANGHAAQVEQSVEVPDFDSGALTHSSLVLSTHPKSDSASGKTESQPSLDGSFRRDQRIGIYLQVYNLSLDPASRQPRASVEYLISNGDQVVFRQQETLIGAETAETTLTKTLSLIGVPPGEYVLKVRISDEVRRQSLEPQAKFRVIS